MVFCGSVSCIIELKIQLPSSFNLKLTRAHDRRLELAGLGYLFNKRAISPEFQRLGDARRGQLLRAAPIAGPHAEFGQLPGTYYVFFFGAERHLFATSY